MERPSAGRRTAWCLPALPLFRAILVILLLTAAVASSVSDAKGSVPPEHAASVSLCLDVDTALQQVNSALESCGVSAAHGATRVGRSNNTRAIHTVDLSPIRRLMRMLGCDTSKSETLARGDTDIHAAQEHGTGVAQQDTASSTIQHGATEPRLLPENRKPKATTAHPAKRQSFQRAHRRVRRDQPASTRECAFQDIFNGTCSGPDSSGHLSITFHTKDRGVPQDADAQPLRQWSETVGNLTITGTVHKAPLRWLLDNGHWSAVTRIELEGLQFRGVSFEMLNAFPGLREIRLRNNDHIVISTAGFKHAAQIHCVEITNSSLRQVPDDSFAKFHSLETLDLHNNHLANVTDRSFAGLTSLTDLDLERNFITTIGEGAFHSLSSLQTLTLWRNNIATLSRKTFHGLSQLILLDLGGNPLTCLSRGLLSPLQELQDLSLDNLGLANVPDGIFNGLGKLTTLYLSGNKLTSLQPGIFRDLESLTHLWLNENELFELHPKVFENLGSLELLYLNDNRLRHLPPALLQNCTKLQDLDLANNQLSSLPSNLLRSTTGLVALWLDRNELTSLDNVLAHAPALEVLMARNNELTSLSTPLLRLKYLVLDNNPITTLPRVTVMPNLTVLLIPGHRMESIDLSPLLELENLMAVDLSASTTVTSTARMEPSALKAWGRTSLKALRITNVDISCLLNREADLPRQQFETLDIGWRGLTEEVLPSTTLCSLLATNARELGIRGSGYSHIELCSNEIDDINLQENLQLQSLQGRHVVRHLNVSGCKNLHTIDILSVAELDISKTNLHPTPALCDTLGHTILYARDVMGDVMDTATLRRCVQIDLVDLSDNSWLRSPMLLNEAIGRDAIGFLDDFKASLHLWKSPVECVATSTPVSIVDGQGSRKTEVRHFFHCTCAQGHKPSNQKCIVDRPNVPVIATGAVLGGLALGMLMMFLYRRYHRLTRRLGEHRQLLLESHEEVLALKKAWEIAFDELHLITRVAAGAFGVVYKAEWDSVMVAVKVLQQGVMAFDESSVAEFEKEVEFLQRTRHPHVVRFFGAGTDPAGTPFLVLEFVALGSLKDVLQKGLEAELNKAMEQSRTEPGQGADGCVGMTDVPGDDLTLVTATPPVNKRWSQLSESGCPITTVWDLKLRLLQDVASGMAFIHSLGQVHRDLKSGNVLVSANLRAKITDFGSIRQCFARKSATRETVLSSASHEPMYSQAVGLATTVNMTMTAGVGTPLYMAPEALTGSSYGSQADMFSFGVLMWEVALQRVPDLIEQEMGADFRGPLLSTLDNLLRQGKRLSFACAEAAEVPDWYVRVCKRCMAWDPTERPTFEELKTSVLRRD